MQLLSKLQTPNQAVARISLALLAAGSLLALAAEPWKLPPETARLKTANGTDIAVANCSLCHSADYISTQPKLSRKTWKASVEKMRTKYGAPIAPDKIDSIVDYLVRNYGLPESNPIK